MSKLFRRITYWIRHRQMETDLAEELEFHHAMKQQGLEQEGLAPADAASQARRALGNTLAATEDARKVWIWSWLDQFVRDTRVGARALAKTPAFTIFSTLILSIGIGAMVTVFTYMNAVFLRPLKIPDPAAFVKVYGLAGVLPVPYSTFVQYRDRNRSLAELGMFFTAGADFPIRKDGPRTLPIDLIQPTMVDGGLFKAIGAGMVIGRGIEQQDELTGSPNVVALNEEAWKKYFAAETGVLGKTIYLNNAPYIVVGVVPGSFQETLSLFPTVSSPHIYLPVRENESPREGVRLAGRLRPGVSRSEAQADFSRIATQLSFEEKVQVSVSVERGDLPPSALWVALAAGFALFLLVVLTVLLIACDDIAIMLLARIAARQREMGIRLALGGSRNQLIAQLLSENILLSILGGVGAMIFVLLASRLIERLQIPLPDTSRAVFDWRVLLFTIFISLATTVFFGLRPALACVSRDVVASLTPGAKSSSQRQARVRSSLVITQITICTALLITAAVVTRSIAALAFTDLGYKSDHLLVGNINFAGSGYDRDAQLAFYRQLSSRLAESHGVESVCIVSNSTDPEIVQLQGGGGNEDLHISTNIIGEGYFRTLRVPLIAGRDFNERDDLNSQAVGIVNRAMALKISRDESPIGRNLRMGDGTSVEIVGVASDIIYRAGAQLATPVLYRPMDQKRGNLPTPKVMLKLSGVPVAASKLLQDAVSEVDRSLLVYNISTMDDELARALLPFRIIGYAMAIPGVFVLLLGIVGTYGTMSILVAQRRREIGIRIALGAHPSRAVRVILTEGMKSTCIGIALGIFGGVIIALWMSRNFNGLQFFDPMAFLTMTLVVIVTAGSACYIPAKRASRVDPMIVLRED